METFLSDHHQNLLDIYHFLPLDQLKKYQDNIFLRYQESCVLNFEWPTDYNLKNCKNYKYILDQLALIISAKESNINFLLNNEGEVISTFTC